MQPGDFLKLKRDEIVGIAAKYGVFNIRVFGSVSRGEADQKSDVDLLITVGRHFSLMDHVRLENELSAALGCKVDVVADRALKRPRFRERVLKDAVPL